jgi:hypothetical protein
MATINQSRKSGEMISWCFGQMAGFDIFPLDLATGKAEKIVLGTFYTESYP